jgi:hypothetical protein
MSLDDPKIIDFVSTAEEPKRAVLTIVDHLEWHADGHLKKLQDKINLYIACVDSGEVIEKFPALKDLPVEIEVRHLFEIDENGRRFLTRTSDSLKAFGFGFSWRQIQK